jgi:proline racemase
MRFSNLITAVDAHACDEPGRVITGGFLNVPGATGPAGEIEIISPARGVSYYL